MRHLVHVGKFLPPPYAGVEAHIDQLLRALAPDWPVMLVAAESPADADAVARLPYSVIPVRRFGTFASATISPGVLSVLGRLRGQGRMALLHVHVPNPWGDIAAVQTPRSIPVVMSWHSDIVRQRNLLRLYRPLQQAAIERADRIVVATPLHLASSRQLQSDRVSHKVAYVPHGVDVGDLDIGHADVGVIEDIRRFACGRQIVLTVGRHVYYKGYDYLLRAFARLRADAVLIMVGEGYLSDKLHRLADELGVTQRVLFMGEVARPALVAAFHVCDVFTLPSVEPAEAFGIASAEAMACGKPTVVCQLYNGVNYLNRDGETSITVPPRDVQALADALDMLLFDDALRSKMGRAAAEWVRAAFSVDAMKRAMVSVYRELM